MKIRSNYLVPRQAVRGAGWMLAALVGLLAGAGPASAQLSRAGNVNLLGTRQQIGAPAIKGTDTAYDPVNNAYLVINAYFPAVAWFVDESGAPLTAFFDIARGGGGFHFPRARYSPHVNDGRGGFLVTYMEEGPKNANVVHARVVAYPGVLVGQDNIISDAGSPAWLESGAAIGYSPASRRFLVAWRGSASSPRLSGRLVDLNGAGVGSVLRLSSGFGRDPGIAWNSATNEFGVLFGAESNTATGSPGFLTFAVVSPADGSFVRQSFNFITGFTYITDVDYNPDTGRYVITWHQKPLGVTEVRAGEIDAAGNLVSSGLVSRDLPGYDALSVAFNPISRTFLLGSIASVSVQNKDFDEIVAAELNANGVRTSPVTSIVPISLVPGILGRYPRVATSTDSARWNISYSDRLSSVNSVTVATTTTGGPPVLTPNPAMAIDTPRAGVVRQPFVLAGWAVDRGANTGTGVDTIHVWAWPVGGGVPVFAGVANYGWARPDVGSLFGSQFTNAGYGLVVNNLPAGKYHLVAYLHSTVSGTFNLSKQVTITISDPLMAIDAPGYGALVPASGFNVGGWSIDRGAVTGTGVDTLHLWAFPVAGGAPIFAGVATYGGGRTDVGAIFGTQFIASGYNATVRNLLPGLYDIVVYSHSTVTRTFNASRVVRVSVIVP